MDHKLRELSERERHYRILQARDVFRRAPTEYQAQRLVDHYKSMFAVVLGMEHMIAMIKASDEVDGNSHGLRSVLKHSVADTIKHQELNLGATMEDIGEPEHQSH